MISRQKSTRRSRRVRGNAPQLQRWAEQHLGRAGQHSRPCRNGPDRIGGDRRRFGRSCPPQRTAGGQPAARGDGDERGDHCARPDRRARRYRPPLRRQRCREGRRRPRRCRIGHGFDARDREVITGNRPDCRPDRWHRFSDQPAGAQRWCGSGARRGGRQGFAVVATEVRALAQRCAEAARDIKGLVDSSTSTVARGVTTVERTRSVLGELTGLIDEISSFITEVASHTAEQVRNLAGVNTDVAEMDQMTQQNAAMVEQSAAAARSLSEQANALSAGVGTFQIKEGMGVQPMIPRHVSAAPPAPAVPAVVKPAVRTQTSGTLALAEDWSEF
ncbi:hypothetical protein C7W88_19390 (plasmid) [Novosphingobium sp. THN1]|nr:hypothetical protein C7W88_19390 [Novosphingobium sp. THN1]